MHKKNISKNSVRFAAYEKGAGGVWVDYKEEEMKSILMSIQPKWVKKIISGEKIIEVRKTAKGDIKNEKKKKKLEAISKRRI